MKVATARPNFHALARSHALFPLTPALCLWETEPAGQCLRGSCTVSYYRNRQKITLSAGERAGARGNSGCALLAAQKLRCAQPAIQLLIVLLASLLEPAVRAEDQQSQ